MTGLELEGIRHSFDGTEVVRGVSLTVHAGEVVSLLGPSGCGKTTCLRIAAGLEPVQAGSVRIDGQELGAPGVHVPPEERSVGLVLQDYALFPHLRVVDNVAFGVRRKGRSAADARTVAMAMLERIGLGDHGQSFPHVLSGGEQQRVALLGAMAPGPRVMLMDEPFSGLDVTLRDMVRDSTLALLKEAGVPTLFVTHDPEEAMRLADRVAIMKAGRILQTGAPQEVYYSPASAQVVSFFGAVNRFETRIAEGRAPLALCDVPVTGIADGTPVEVLLRPQAIRLDRGMHGIPVAGGAVVERTQFMGPAFLVDLRFGDDPGAGGQILRARVAARDVPATGARVDFFINPADVFVFPLAYSDG
ncbi:MAG: ABC transporter ATP-binding protein [Sphingomonadales bacterium]